MFVSSLSKGNPFKSPIQKYPCPLFTSCSSTSSISFLCLAVLCHSGTNKSLCAENLALGYPELMQSLSGIVLTNWWRFYLYFFLVHVLFCMLCLTPLFFNTICNYFLVSFHIDLTENLNKNSLMEKRLMCLQFQDETNLN